jgi:hypothetical protein
MVMQATDSMFYNWGDELCWKLLPVMRRVLIYNETVSLITASKWLHRSTAWTQRRTGPVRSG